MFTLRFPLNEIHHWSGRYNYRDDAPLDPRIIPFMQKERYLTKPLFLELARWKSPRPGPLCASNSDSYVEQVTQVALMTEHEQLRIEVLTLLRGVSWPMASVILHFGYDNLYPILDFRALWSIGFDVPPAYSFTFWWDYTCNTRQIAADAGVTLRELDRALWQFSNEHQNMK